MRHGSQKMGSNIERHRFAGTGGSQAHGRGNGEEAGEKEFTPGEAKTARSKLEKREEHKKKKKRRKEEGRKKMGRREKERKVIKKRDAACRGHWRKQ